jgi:hypothetical protein
MTQKPFAGLGLFLGGVVISGLLSLAFVGLFNTQIDELSRWVEGTRWPEPGDSLFRTAFITTWWMPSPFGATPISAIFELCQMVCSLLSLVVGVGIAALIRSAWRSSRAVCLRRGFCRR